MRWATAPESERTVCTGISDCNSFSSLTKFEYETVSEDTNFGHHGVGPRLKLNPIQCFAYSNRLRGCQLQLLSMGRQSVLGTKGATAEVTSRTPSIGVSWVSSNLRWVLLANHYPRELTIYIYTYITICLYCQSPP